MRYLLGIDNGGTFVKAGIVSEEGQLIAAAREPVEQINPKAGFAERDMNALWSQNAKVIRSALEQSGIRPEQLSGVSFSGHGKGLYLVDDQGRPVYHGILSTDTRAWRYVNQWQQDGTAGQVFEKTLQPILACQPVSLLAWIKDNEPEVYDKTAYLFSVNDYIRYCLTGAANAEYTVSSGGNLVNLNTFQYDYELMELFGLEEMFDKLPPLRFPADLCGTVTKAAAAATGLAEGTPVTAGMFDVDACGLASGLDNEQALCMIAGTWSINEYLARQPIAKEQDVLNSMSWIPGYFLIEESSPTSAGNLEWFINTFLDWEKELVGPQNIYNLTNQWVAEIKPEESDVIFLPFLNGSKEDVRAKGTFIGMTEFHTKAHLVRAVYEGIVFSHLAHVKRLLKHRQPPETVRLAGGAANSEVWVQMFADALQIPVETVAGKEQGIIGAAMAAGVGTGVFAGYDEGVRRLVRVENKVFPRAEYQSIYQQKYNRYRIVADSVSAVWSEFE